MRDQLALVFKSSRKLNQAEIPTDSELLDKVQNKVEQMAMESHHRKKRQDSTSEFFGSSH